MAILKVRTYPDPFLRVPTKPVEKIDDEIQKIIQDMAETMYASAGVGLASIQVGIDKSIIVYDISQKQEEENQEYQEKKIKKQNLEVIINPKIIHSEGVINSENEGCLSVLDFRSDVKRAKFVIIEALDRNGNLIKINASDYFATVLQHEIDHLNGILFIDRISVLKRELYKRKINKLLKSKNKK